MIGRAGRLMQRPEHVRALKGIGVAEYQQLTDEVRGPYAATEQQRPSHPERRRAGQGSRLPLADQVLPTIVRPR